MARVGRPRQPAGLKIYDKVITLRRGKNVVRRSVSLLIAAIMICGPAVARSMSCSSAPMVAAAGEDCMAAMANKRQQPSKQCIEHCAALASTACVLATGLTPTPARATDVVSTLSRYAPLGAIAVELSFPPPRTFA